MFNVSNPFKPVHQSIFCQAPQVLKAENYLTKSVIDLIKKEVNLNCPICFLQYDSSQKYPVQICINKHIICRVCVDKLKPKSVSQSFSRNQSKYLCPTCKTQFSKENVQRNRIIENIAAEVIPKITSTLQDHLQLNKNLQTQRQKEIQAEQKKQVLMLRNQCNMYKDQCNRFRNQCNMYKDQCNRFRGLQELNKINSLTIKLLSQENDNLKQELKGLQNQLLQNYSLFPANNSKTKAITNKSSRDIQKLTEKQIRQKIVQKNIWKAIDNRIHKYFHFISTVNIEVLQTLELKGIGMNNAQFVILLRIEFKSLRKLSLAGNKISMDEMDYYFQNIKKLKELDLSSNQTKHLPRNLSQLQQLNILNLQHNQLTQFSKSILQLPNLTVLNLKNNPISHNFLDKIQFVSKQIQILQIDCDLIKCVFPILKDQNLKSFTVSDNLPSIDMISLIFSKKVQNLTFQKYLDVNDFLQKMDCKLITCLKLKGNLIRKVKLKHCEFSSLKKLSIIQPFLVQIPTAFVQGGNLQQLEIKCEQAVNIPTQLQRNTQLRQIKMQIKEITEFPSYFYTFTQLQTIELQNLYLYNQLDEPNSCFISQQVKSLKCLTKISLRSLIHMEIDLSHLLEALARDQKIVKVRCFELYNLFIDQNTLQKILKLKYINTLVLSKGGIQRLPDSIAELKELVDLNLSQNKLLILPPALFTLTTLEKLNIKLNPINNIPPQIMQLHNLVQLQMDVNREISRERDIKLAYQLFHKEIQVLKEQRFDIQIFQKQIQAASDFMEFIQENEIANNQDQIQVEPYRFTCSRNISPFQAFTQLQFYRLVQLSLTDLELTTKEIYFLRMKTDLKYLRTLDLSKNSLQLYRGDECFTAWPELTQLNLSYNLIEQIPSDISTLHKLEILNLSHNKQRVIQKELQCMPKLTNLDLSDNQLQRVELSLVEQKNMLVKLNLQNNNLQQVPAFVYQADLMQQLNLSYNNQKCLINKRIETLVKLQNFKGNFINNNCLSVFMFSMPQIKEVQLNVPQNSAIPPSLPSLSLTKIVKLSLEGYNFKNVPQQICALSQTLTHLNLSKNMIEKLDQNVTSFKVLKVLELKFNPLVYGLAYLKKNRLQLLDLSFIDLLCQNQLEVICELKSLGVIVITSFESDDDAMQFDQNQVI